MLIDGDILNHFGHEPPKRHISISKLSGVRRHGSLYDVSTPLKQITGADILAAGSSIKGHIMVSNCSISEEQNILMQSEKIVNVIDSCSSDFSSESNEILLKDDERAYKFFSKENTTRINISRGKMANWTKKMKQCQ